jgi:hypothetical protein
MNVADLAPKLASSFSETQHGTNFGRVAIQVPVVLDRAVVDGLHISNLSPPPGLEDVQPTPHLMKPPGLDAMGVAKTPPCAETRRKESAYDEKSGAYIAQSLETLPTEASGYTPLSSPRSEASSDASVGTMSSQGKLPSPQEEFVSDMMPWVGQRMSF